MPKPFLEYLLENINDSRKIPKAQVERAISPFLDIFIEEIISSALKHNEECSGNIIKICPEFPLKKPGDTKQSTNIDWLMCNPDKKQILLVELKTSDSSVESSFKRRSNQEKSQFEIYQSVKDRIATSGGTFLIDELFEIREGSGQLEKLKYNHIIDVVKKYADLISSCFSAEIVYIVPKTSINKAMNYVEKGMTFSDFPKEMPGIYENEWRIIRKYLTEFDNNPMYKDTDQALKKTRPEPEGYLKFDEVVRLCEKYQDEIIVGFTGGEEALIKAPFHRLINRRHYKWDYSKNLQHWNTENWILGGRFLELLRSQYDLD